MELSNQQSEDAAERDAAEERGRRRGTADERGTADDIPAPSPAPHDGTGKNLHDGTGVV